MQKVKDFFKNLNLLDYFLYIFGFVGVIVSSIIVKSSVLTILYAITGIIYVRLMAKQYKECIFFGIVYVAIYIAQSAIYKNWGEVILYSAISLPILIFTSVNWFTGKNKKKDKLNNNPIKYQEWCILISVSLLVGVGIYFLLNYFDTPNLIIAVISFIIGVIGNYLILREDGKMFICFISLNVIQILLWVMPIFKEYSFNYLEILPMIFTLIVFLISNFDGTIRWLREQKIESGNSKELDKNFQDDKTESKNNKEENDINSENKLGG